MRSWLSFAAFSSLFVLGACVADPPEIMAGGEAADDAGAGSWSSADGGDSAGDALSESCAEIDSGGDICSGGAPVCCAVQEPGGGFNSVSFECAASNASCAALNVGVAITCRQPSDCPSGSVCCGRKSSTNNSVFVSVKCETSCDGVSSFGQATYCDPSDPHTCDGSNSGTTPFCEPADFPGMFDCEHE